MAIFGRHFRRALTEHNLRIGLEGSEVQIRATRSCVRALQVSRPRLEVGDDWSCRV